MPPVYDAVAARDARGCTSAPPAWWEQPRARRPGGVPLRRRPEAPRRARGRRRAAGVRDLPAATSRSATSGPETTLRTLEVIGATPEATASIWRYLLDVDWTQTVAARLLAVDSPLFLLLARPNLRAARRCATGSGCGSSTSAPRSSGRTLRRRRLRRLRRPRRVLPVERGPLEARGRRGGAHRRGRRPRARRRRPRLALPRRVHLPRARGAPAASRSCARARSTARTRCSARTSRPGAPRSSEPEHVVHHLERAHHQQPRGRREEHLGGDIVVEEIRQERRSPAEDDRAPETGRVKVQIPRLPARLDERRHLVDAALEQGDRLVVPLGRGRTGRLPAPPAETRTSARRSGRRRAHRLPRRGTLRAHPGPGRLRPRHGAHCRSSHPPARRRLAAA